MLDDDLEDDSEKEEAEESESNARFIERALGTLSCCGVPRPPSLSDDEPCPNCGAI